MIHTVKNLNVANETEVEGFLEFSCFFHAPVDFGNLISGSAAFSKSNLYIWKFLVHMLLKPSLKDFEHYLVSMWNTCNCAYFSINYFILLHCYIKELILFKQQEQQKTWEVLKSNNRIIFPFLSAV